MGKDSKISVISVCAQLPPSVFIFALAVVHNHSYRLWTFGAALVHTGDGGCAQVVERSCFRNLWGDDENVQYIQLLYILCKTDAPRMRYLGRDFSLDKNRRFLTGCLYYIGYQPNTKKDRAILLQPCKLGIVNWQRWWFYYCWQCKYKYAYKKRRRLDALTAHVHRCFIEFCITKQGTITSILKRATPSPAWPSAINIILIYVSSG